VQERNLHTWQIGYQQGVKECEARAEALKSAGDAVRAALDRLHYYEVSDGKGMLAKVFGGQLVEADTPGNVWLISPDNTGKLMLELPASQVTEYDLKTTVRVIQEDMIASGLLPQHAR
jgi:hypothetical protein